MIVANSALRASLAIYHRISNARSWNNCQIYHLLTFHNSLDSEDDFRSGCRNVSQSPSQDYTHPDDHNLCTYVLGSNHLQYYNESCSDVNKLFPSGHVGGVSSAIVLSQNQSFAIFTKVNYEGLQTALNPGMWCDNPEAMGFPNDKLQSFRKM